MCKSLCKTYLQSVLTTKPLIILIQIDLFNNLKDLLFIEKEQGDYHDIERYQWTYP